MLLLTFQAGSQNYAINAKSVQEVIPLVRTRELAGAPDFVCGVFSYRGTLVPVIDVTQMLSGKRSAEHLSSRIIIVKYPDAEKSENVLGLLAEHVTSTASRKTETFADPGVAIPGAPWLGKISVEEKGMLQIVKIEDILTDELKATLFVASKEKPL